MLASTSSLYGAHNPLPFREDADTNRPLSPYAASQEGGRGAGYTYHHLHGLDVTVFRYFTVYGPAGRPDMSIFRFIRWIAEGGPVGVYRRRAANPATSPTWTTSPGAPSSACGRWATR